MCKFKDNEKRKEVDDRYDVAKKDNVKTKKYLERCQKKLKLVHDLEKCAKLEADTKRMNEEARKIEQEIASSKFSEEGKYQPCYCYFDFIDDTRERNYHLKKLSLISS